MKIVVRALNAFKSFSMASGRSSIAEPTSRGVQDSFRGIITRASSSASEKAKRRTATLSINVSQHPPATVSGHASSALTTFHKLSALTTGSTSPHVATFIKSQYTPTLTRAESDPIPRQLVETERIDRLQRSASSSGPPASSAPVSGGSAFDTQAIARHKTRSVSLHLVTVSGHAGSTLTTSHKLSALTTGSTSPHVSTFVKAKYTRTLTRVESDPNSMQLRATERPDRLQRSTSSSGPAVSSATISGGSAFDTQAIARRKSLSKRERAARHMHHCTSLSSAESAHPAWARVAMGQSIPSSIASSFFTIFLSFFTIFTNCLLGLWIIFHMCLIAPPHFVFAGCMSSHPPWVSSSPKSPSVRARLQRPLKEDYRQSLFEDSTEDMWALEALCFDYDF